MLMSDSKILVVDDSSVIRETLESYFAEEGYTVAGAETAEAAELLLNEQELIKNKMGELPIFSIPEIMCKYA